MQRLACLTALNTLQIFLQLSCASLLQELMSVFMTKDIDDHDDNMILINRTNSSDHWLSDH